jgi:hypothetical protein
MMLANSLLSNNDRNIANACDEDTLLPIVKPSAMTVLDDEPILQGIAKFCLRPNPAEVEMMSMLLDVDSEVLEVWCKC